MATLLRRHTRSIVVVAGILLFALGWLAGSWATCRGSACHFDVQLFDAIGTWVGGVGTVIAVVIATNQLRTSIASTNQTARSDEAEADESARRVKLRAKPLKPNAGLYNAVGVTVANTSNQTLTALVLRTADGRVLTEAKQVDPRREWLVTVPVGNLNLKNLLIDGTAEARVRTEVENILELEFDLKGYSYVRTRTDMRKPSA